MLRKLFIILIFVIRPLFAQLNLSQVVYPKGIENTVYREIFKIEPEQGEALTLLDLCMGLGRAAFSKGLELLLSMPAVVASCL